LEYTQDDSDTDEREVFEIPLDTGGTWVNAGNGVGLRVLFVIAAGADNANAVEKTWADVFTATGNQVNGVTATTDRFRIRNVKLELGRVATTYTHEDLTDNLKRCQRFYYKTFPLGTAPAGGLGTTGALTRRLSVAGVASQGIDIRFPTRMNDTPTATFYSPSTGTGVWYNLTGAAESGNAALEHNGDSGVFINHTQVSADAVGDRCSVHAVFKAQL
jgi:hypothetical protein